MVIYSPVISGSLTISGSIITTSGGLPLTGSLISSGSFTSIGPTVVSGSFTVVTGSAVEFQVLDAGVKIGNLSSDNHTVTGSLLVSGSITTAGTITAQTLVVQTITSSVSFITGSTKFGVLAANTHQFTGSVYMNANTNGLFVSSSGQIGINTITPNVNTFSGAAKGIEMYTGAGGYAVIKLNSADLGNFYLVNGVSQYWLYGEGNYPMVFYTSGSERMRISANGSVGIGTTTPFSQLSLPSGNGWNGGLAWNYTTNNSASKRWWINTDQIAYGDFRIATEITQGGGTISSAGTLYERFYISAAGSVSIGSTSTAYNFNVYGASSADGWGAFFGGAGTTKGGIYLGNDGTQYGTLYFDNANNNVVLKQSYASGTVNVIANTGGVTLANGGTSWAAISSDIRKKKNFETVPGLDAILQIEPIKYHFNWEEDNKPKRLGFKAQNIQPLIPEMVLETGEFAEDGSPYLTVTPDYILPVLVKAIQELKAENDTLKEILQRNNIQ
jgi:hypothetical protein